MASAKELARTITCPWWKLRVACRKDFCWAQIYNAAGKPVKPSVASKGGGFYHLRVVFKFEDSDKAAILGDMLCNVASTSSERMDAEIFQKYGFTEIMIS